MRRLCLVEKSSATVHWYFAKKGSRHESRSFMEPRISSASGTQGATLPMPPHEMRETGLHGSAGLHLASTSEERIEMQRIFETVSGTSASHMLVPGFGTVGLVSLVSLQRFYRGVLWMRADEYLSPRRYLSCILAVPVYRRGAAFGRVRVQRAERRRQR